MLDAELRATIVSAVNRSDLAAAFALADAALADGVSDPMLLNLVAWRAEDRGDFQGAYRALNAALVLAPADATIVTAMGTALRKEGRIAAALAEFDRAMAIDPDYAVPWLERGFALDGIGETRAAGAAYLRAAELDPRLAPAFAGAGAMATRLGEVDAARAFAARALALDPDNAVAALAWAKCDIDAGAAAAAAARLGVLIGVKGTGPEDRIAALTLLGDALDRLDKPAEAFTAWRTAKEEFAALHAARFVDQVPQRTFIEALTARVRAVEPYRWQRPAAPANRGRARGHVFLLGYPRSGTTLVENILASAAGVVAREEQPTFAEADHFLGEADGLERLLALDEAAVERLRDAYWARAVPAGMTVANKVVVDMDPLKGIKLPLIARLFPDARIVVMHRDPRDVVLSCFRQNFRISAAAFAFTRLDEAARHYAATMTLTRHCLKAIPLPWHVVRYEEIVNDFDAATRQLCDFVGIAWSPALRGFDRTAQRRGVTTASAAQVTRGLYSGAGQWRRYAPQLEPVGPILQPWLDPPSRSIGVGSGPPRSAMSVVTPATGSGQSGEGIPNT